MNSPFRSDSDTGREQPLSVTTHPRHQLGGYREFDPPASLALFAEALWTHRAPGELPPGDGAMHRVLPDPALSLAFYCRRRPDGVPTEPKLIVIGPKSRPHIFAFRSGQEIAAVRVKLEWSAPLLDLVPEDHADAECGDRDDEIVTLNEVKGAIYAWPPWLRSG